MTERPERGNLHAWWTAQWHVRPTFLYRFVLSIPLLYLITLAALYHWQRDILFARPAEWQEEPRPAEFVERIVKEADGTRLRIWQSGPPAEGKATIVFFYGNAGTLSDFADVGAALRTQGFGVVLASYRGYSNNPGFPSEEGLFEDARAILGTIPHISAPVILWGQSLGSGVAARMAAEGRASGLILQSPYTSIVDLAAVAYPMFPVRMLDTDPFDTLSLVPKIKIPVLIIHGTDDSTVPFWMGKRLALAFGNNASLVPIVHGGHNDLIEAETVPPALNWLNANSKVVALKRPTLDRSQNVNPKMIGH